MKFATTWYSTQFLAETEEDEILLRKLMITLPTNCRDKYENGIMQKMKPCDADDCSGFISKEIEESLLCIEFCK